MTKPPVRSSGPVLSDVFSDGRQVGAAAARNQSVIVDALGALLTGRSGMVLEIGSGTGQHAAAFAKAFPDLAWQPTDMDAGNITSINAWRQHIELDNLRAPILLNAREPWPDTGPLAGVLSINVLQVAPWSVAEAIVANAARLLAPGGVMMFYSPFSIGGQHISDGNAEFDRSLKARNPALGVRDLDELAALAGQNGFGPPTVTEMPANNRLAAFPLT